MRAPIQMARCCSCRTTPRLSRGPAEGGAVGLNHFLGNNIRLGLARRSQLADYFEVSGTYFESHEELLSGLSNTRCPFQHRKFWVLVRREPSQAANALPRRKASCRLKLSKAICCDDSLSDICEFIDCHGSGAQRLGSAAALTMRSVGRDVGWNLLLAIALDACLYDTFPKLLELPE